MKKTKSLMAIAAAALFAASPIIAHEGHEHQGKEAVGENKENVTVKGEVLDMACYLDHNATGEKHIDCAKKCTNSGLPVGIKGEDGKTYLLIGEHKPMNSELAQYAGKSITVKGKLSSRDGINIVENAEIQK
jgi:type 1 fimbria pilin